jgi:hypothetical protein
MPCGREPGNAAAHDHHMGFMHAQCPGLRVP